VIETETSSTTPGRDESEVAGVSQRDRDPSREAFDPGPTARPRPARPAAVATGPLKSTRPFLGYAAEVAAYARIKPTLLEEFPGRFVVFVGEDMLGPFDDFRAAYIAARRRFGPGPVFIKHVLAEEPISETVGLYT